MTFVLVVVIQKANYKFTEQIPADASWVQAQPDLNSAAESTPNQGQNKIFCLRLSSNTAL